MENIIIVVIGLIITYISGIYLPKKFRKKDKRPKISIGPFQEKQNYFDVTNHGGDILNLKIEISWLQEGNKQKRKMNNFFNSNENPAFGYPHNCNSLKSGETKKVIDCPLYSDDSNIEVLITGKDINGQKYKENLILKNKIKK